MDFCCFSYLLKSHFSRGSFGSTRAPGADDDGSGTTALLSIAKTIARRGVRFNSNVEFVAFAGEEQGLYGSRAYSRKSHLSEETRNRKQLKTDELKAAGANITMMAQADMLAYR